METISNNNILSMILGSGPVVQAVLIILILLSLWTWTIMIAKHFQFKKAMQSTKEFTNLFWETRNLSRIDDSCARLSESPLVSVFRSGYRELSHQLGEQAERRKQGNQITMGNEVESVKMALKRSELDMGIKLEKGLTFLATVASAAPFIGLFGTVWGIMKAFHGLGFSKTSTIQAVAPGISEALVATAVGLAAAIPASIAYNYFSVSVRNFRSSMSRFSEEFLSIAGTNL